MDYEAWLVKKQDKATQARSRTFLCDTNLMLVQLEEMASCTPESRIHDAAMDGLKFPLPPTGSLKCCSFEQMNALRTLEVDMLQSSSTELGTAAQAHQQWQQLREASRLWLSPRTQKNLPKEGSPPAMAVLLVTHSSAVIECVMRAAKTVRQIINGYRRQADSSCPCTTASSGTVAEMHVCVPAHVAGNHMPEMCKRPRAKVQDGDKSQANHRVKRHCTDTKGHCQRTQGLPSNGSDVVPALRAEPAAASHSGNATCSGAPGSSFSNSELCWLEEKSYTENLCATDDIYACASDTASQASDVSDTEEVLLWFDSEGWAHGHGCYLVNQ